MRLIVLGPPGSGKGTQARLLANRLDVVHLSTGALMRAEVDAGSPLGRRIADTVAAGDLVPIDDVLATIRPPLSGAGGAGASGAGGAGWVLDGIPRTVPQAVALAEMLEELQAPAELVLALEVPDDDVRARLHLRRRIAGRVDDEPATIEHRLAVWAREGPPLLRWYEERGVLVRVDGTGDLDAVTDRVVRAASLSR